MKKIKILLLLAVAFIGLTNIASAQQLNESFETWPPTDWTLVNSSCSSNDIVQTTEQAYAGTNSLRLRSWSSCASYDQYAITPELVVTAGDQTISFWYRKYSSGSETFCVGWSSTGTNTGDFTWGPDVTNASTTWQEYSKTDVPVGTKYIAIHYKSNYQYNLYIDSVVGPAVFVPSCPKPNTLTASAITPTAAVLSWAAGTTETEWQIEYGAAGFTQGTGTYSTVLTNPTTALSSLSSITSYDVYVRGVCAVGDTSDWSLVENFTTLPSCPVPTALASNNVMSTSADISWLAGYTETEWQIEYGVSGFTQGTGTYINNLSSLSTTLSGLTANTAYDVYLRAVCAVGDSSDWTDISFTTLCGTYSIPFSEDFSSFMPDCWEQAKDTLAAVVDFTSTTSNWVADGYLNSGTTGAAKNNVYGTGRYDWLITPSIDLGTTSPTQIEFDLGLTDFGNGNAPDNLLFTDDKFAVIISLDNGITWTDANALVIYDSNSTTLNYIDIPHTGTHVVLDLTAYSGIVKFAFYAESLISNTDNDLFIDNVQVREIPQCFEPTDFTVNSLDSTTVNISWTAGGTETEWFIEYGAPNFVLGTGTVIDSINVTDTTITGLTAETSYDIYVRSVCGVGDSSSWTGPLSIITNCNAYTAPYMQSFDVNLTPDCWLQYNMTGGPWAFGQAGSAGYNALTTDDHTGNSGYFAWVDFSGTDDSVVLEMNTVDVSTLTHPALKFFYFSSTNTVDQVNSLFVEAWNGTTWTVMNEIIQNNTAWTEHIINLAPYVYNTNFTKLRFRAESCDGNSDYNNDLLIDDIQITEGPSCYDVSNIDVLAQYFGTTANVIWNPGYLETEWVLEYGNAGFTQGNGTTVSVLTTPQYLISGLNPSSNYDVYVRGICGPTDSSMWVGPINFTTLATCIEPTALTSYGVTSTSADLTWTAGYLETEWQIEYGVDGFTQGTGTYINNITNDSITITALNSNETYDVYLRSVCAVGDSSVWINTNFTTDCAIYSIPFSEDFAAYPPACWEEGKGQLIDTTVFTSASSNWTSDDYLNVTSPVNKSARINLWSTNKFEWFFSPSIDLGTVGTSLLEFNIGLTDYGNSNVPDNQSGTDDKVAVVISTDNGATWSDANALMVWDSNANTPSYYDIPNTGMHVAIPLTGYSGIVRFGFYAESTVSNADNDLFIDEFKVSLINPSADSLVITEIMYNSPETGTDSLEFVEIYNNSNNYYDLSGAQIGYRNNTPHILDAATFIEPYSYYIVSTDSAAFGGFYGFEADLDWDATTGLSNGGGSVWIKNAAGVVVDTVVYDDGGVWPSEADGDGYSLILCDPSMDNNDGNNWFVSFVNQGYNADMDFVNASPAAMNNCETIDLGVLMPGTATTTFTYCTSNLGYQTVSMINNGTVAIPAGETVTYTVDMAGNPSLIVDNIVLTNDWNVGDTLYHQVSQTLAGTPVGTYSIQTWVGTYYFEDENVSNDTANMVLEVIEIDVDFLTDSINVDGGLLPYTLDAGNTGINATYLWNTGATTQTISATTTGVYSCTVTAPLDPNGLTCSDFDSVTLWMPPCVDPTNIMVYNIAPDTADVSWTAGATETEWTIEYGTAGFAQGSGTSVQVLTTPMYTISSLNALTSYDVYVKAICNVGNESAWVGPIQFTTALPSYPDTLVITEIMYNPPENGSDSLEFVEIYNNSMYANDINGYEIGYKNNTPHTITSTTVIAPYSYFIISTDSAAFGGFYGFEANLDWDATSGLSNGGGSVWIKNAAGVVVDTVVYDDGGSWPTEPDGNGNSLILCDYTADNNDVANWGISRMFVANDTANNPVYASPAYINDCSYDDIAVSIPGTTPTDYYFCESNLTTVDVEMINLGTRDINIGDTVLYSVDMQGNPSILIDTIVLTNIWTMGSTLQHTFSATLAGTTVGTYAVQTWVTLPNAMDIDNTNDTANCNFIIIDLNVDLGADSLEIITSGLGLPYTLDAGNAGIGATYLWSTGETTQTISAASLGQYSVEVTSPIDLNGNSCSDNDTIVLYSTDGIEENDININIFPNPTSSIVNIEIESYNEDVVLEIVNMNGQTIVSDELKSTQRQVSYDLSIYPAGVYTVVVRNNNFVKTTKVVKQ